MVADWSRWLSFGFGHRAAGDASHKRQYLGNPDLYGHKGFFVAVTKDHQKMLMGSMNERIIDPLADCPVHLEALRAYIGATEIPL